MTAAQSDTATDGIARSGMIWTDVAEEYPDGGYIHPLHEGQGHDGRKYRPVWHATQQSLSPEIEQSDD